MSKKPDLSPDGSGIPKRLNPTATDGRAGSSVEGEVEKDSSIPGASLDRVHLWFDETVVVPDEFRTLLMQYGHITPEEVDEHVIRVRNRAWKVNPYPCLGQFRFLEFNLAHRAGDIYTRLLNILKDPSSKSSGILFLDVGTCLGQDIRKLIYDGVSPSVVAGTDLSSSFLEQGYELFRDSPETVKMVEANILSPLTDGNPLAQWKGKLKAVQLGMIIHLFTWEEQITAFVNAIALLSNETGVFVFGQASGNIDGRETRTLSASGAECNSWKHNVESFQRLVKDVEVKTGMRWAVVAELDDALSVNDGKRSWDDPKTRRLLFEIRRVE